MYTLVLCLPRHTRDTIGVMSSSCSSGVISTLVRGPVVLSSWTFCGGEQGWGDQVMYNTSRSAVEWGHLASFHCPRRGGGGGAQLKRHPPTHRLTNTQENIREKNSSASGARNMALPLKTTNPLPTLGPGWGGPIRRKHAPF